MLNSKLWNKKALGSYLILVTMILTIIITITYGITTSAVNSFNKVVLVYLVISIICDAVYLFIPQSVAEIGNLGSIIFLTLAFMTFIVNSINTFADVLNGISMFGSTGGITSIIIILVMMFMGIGLGIISCFMKRDK